MPTNPPVAALTHAIESLGGSTRGDGEQLTIVSPAGHEVLVSVRQLGAITAADVAKPLVAKSTEVIVADLVPQSLRPLLAAAGFNWLDRRGHLRLVTDDLWIDAEVPSTPRTQASHGRRGIVGPAQIAVAAAQLVGWQLGVRELARRVGLSAAAISKARRALVARGLVTAEGSAAVPELFWALADAWTIRWTDLGQRPPPDPSLVVTGTVAAAALGAPVVASVDWPIELVSNDANTVDRATYRAGAGAVTHAPAARIGLAPTPLVSDPELITCDRAFGFALAHPLFVALDLAQDPARGVEALETWDPVGFDRVW